MRNYFIIIFILFALALSIASYAEKDLEKVIIFYSSNCQSCIKLNAEFLPKIEAKYKDRIKMEYRDIKEIENYKLLLSYEEKYNKKKKTLPIIFIEGKFLSGEKEVKEYLERFIDYALRTQTSRGKEILPSIDLILRFKTFSPWAIIFAGLIDGINPCAFTVIVFFVTFLALQKYRKKEIIATGLSFILAVYVAYLLLGLGLFNFLYRLRLFSYVLKIIYSSVALLCFILGFLTIYDILRFKKNRQGEEMVLRLPDKIKYNIQRIIGLYYRQTDKEKPPRKSILGLILSAIVVGFIIAVLEAVCTGQVYLPTIAFVLKISNLKIQALAYLALYNLMFIVPLFLVFLFALLGVSSGEFSYFMQRRMIMIKMLMAGLFFILGIILIFGI